MPWHTRRGFAELAAEGAAVGLAGAASLVLTDVVGRREDLDAVERGALRVTAAVVTGYLLYLGGAPAAVVTGALAAPVLRTALDCGTAALPARRLEPPPQPIASAGLPWAPHLLAPR